MIARAAPRVGLTIGSLFSGIGGLELGLERAGLGPVKWQVEIDPYCRAVLAKHWPDARRYEDVRVVGPELERVGIICGGFPCQDISPAGAKAGITGDQSGLWTEFKRTIGNVGPDYVVVENSAELPKRGLDRVLADLAALGFDAVWFPVAAADVGAPHLRNRCFVVGYPNVRSQSTFAVNAEARGVQGVDEATAHVDGAGQEAGGSGGGNGVPKEGQAEHGESAPGRRHGTRGHWEAAEPDLVRVVHGVRSGVDRIGALGNAVVPQVAEVVGWVVRGIHERLTR